MATQQIEPPLFRLPPEIRNQIYSYVLPGSYDHRVEFLLTPYHTRPSLLSLNKRLRAEATGLFYSSTTFILQSHHLGVEWLASLPSDQQRLIQEIRYDTTGVCKDNTGWRSAFQDRPGQDAQRRLTALQHDLAAKGVLLDDGVLKAPVTVNGRTVWTSEPLATAMEAMKDGAWLGLVMFV